MESQEKVDYSKMSDREVFKTLVAQQYAPTSGGAENPSESALFRTSLELQHEFRESCEPSIADISSVMMELKFQGKPFDRGQFAWILYPKDADEYVQRFDPS